MNIKTLIDEKYNEPELHVCNNEINDEIKGIVSELHEIFDRKLTGVDEKGNKHQLHPGEIISAYAEGQKVMVRSEEGCFAVQKKLYELETELGERNFVRISKSEIVNIRKIKNMDLSITGTIRLLMKNGYETYVSRRNVSKIKEKLLEGR